MAQFDSGMETLIDAFAFETNELLENLDDILMQSEKGELSEDNISEIFRIMHTIKGSSAMMGFENMSMLAHSIEDLFYIIRENSKIVYDKEKLYDLVFVSLDLLKNEMSIVFDKSMLPTDFSQVIEEIRKFIEDMNQNEISSKSTGIDMTEIFSKDEGPEIQTVKITYEDSCAMPSVRGMIAIRNISDYADVINTIPSDFDDDAADRVILSNGLYIKLITDDITNIISILQNEIDVVSAEQVFKNDIKKDKDDKTSPANIETKTTDSENINKPSANKSEGEKLNQSSFVSVKLEKLDRLLDIVAEIVIAQSSVTASPDLKPYIENMENFSKSSRELKKLTDELQDVVMSIRTVPISTTFSKMNRVVRDMNKHLVKDVELVIKGQETEVDKSIVDILSDPLMHIVRNAIDHGIESPEEREAKGKTDKPQVVLSAGYESSEVVISCTDNGNGMDWKKILSVAKSKGILTKPENEYTENESYNLIMAAGFSTNNTITEYSGRGVGMDIVRKNIEKVGGTISVTSDYGKGSTFKIRIPLSLSIFDVLGIDVGKSNFSIAVSSIREIFSAKPEQIICDPNGTELVMLRGKCIPVIRLSEAFNIKTEKLNLADGVMIYCKEAGRSAVIFADRLTIEQQIVVKPFSPLFSKYDLKDKGISGCSILADGSITLVIDVKELFKKNNITVEKQEN